MSIQCPPGSFPYIIKSGDTFFRIAQQFNSSVNAISAFNPGINPNALIIGQTICIPGAAPVVCPPGSLSYVIQPGDTLFALVQKFATTLTAIFAINPGINPNTLNVGQTICIPPVTTTCPGNNIYTIQPGDTLYLIAARYDVSIGSLLDFNPGLDPDLIIPGQRLCIPPQRPICPGNNKYVIGPNENLNSLAAKFSVNAGDILVANPRLRPSEFTPGITICIPLHHAP